MRGVRNGRQLQHGRVLAFTQPGEQNHLPIGELKRVVMHVRLVLFDLSEPSHLLAELPVREEAKRMVALDFPLP